MTQTGTLMVVYYNSAAEDELVGCLLRGPNLNFGGEPSQDCLLLLLLLLYLLLLLVAAVAVCFIIMAALG